MRVILKQQVKGVGSAGDVKDVSDGYARNFLLPRGLAVEADETAIRTLEQKRRSTEKKEARELAEAKELQAIIQAKSLDYAVNAGEGGRLFGSVTSKDIADQLARTGVRVDRRKLMLEEPIRQLGEYQVEIRLHPEVTAKLKIKVTTG